MRNGDGSRHERHPPSPIRHPLVVVRGAAPADGEAVEALAARLAPPPPVGRSAPVSAATAPWTLLVDGARRVLIRPDGVRLELDFTAGRTAARSRERGLARQPLARALGVTRLHRRLGRAPRIVDATGGLGRDAWFAASVGCPVLLIERSPVVHALLEAALARARATPSATEIAARVTLRHADAVTALPALDASLADVIYLDPMYPPRRRRAAVTKGMQFLHALLGPADDGATLLAAALPAAACQTTVKRPVGAPPLAGDDAFRGQRTTIESPGTRYDVYLSAMPDPDAGFSRAP